MGRTSARKGGGGSAKAAWPKEQLLREAYDLLRQRKRDLAAARGGEGTSSATTQAKLSSSGSATATRPRDSTTPSDAAKLLAASGPKLVGETKDTGFKRPAKLQRKLDEIKENPTAEEKPAKKRRVSSDEIKPAEEQTPTYGYGGYFRGHLEEPVDGEYYPTTIFVGGLSEQTEERDLERAFSRFGPIDAIRLIHNKNFGFVKFRTPDACQASILGMNGEILGSSRIRVDRAKVPSSRGPWRRRSWDPRPYPSRDDAGDDYYYRGPEGPDHGGGPYAVGRERDMGYAPYGMPSLRGEATPVPFPATPQPYSVPPLSSSPGFPPTSTPDREPLDPEADAGGAEDSSDPGRRRVQYNDL